MRVAVLGAVTVLAGAIACKGEGDQGGAAPTSASAPSAVASAPPEKPPAPWFVGKWGATFSVEGRAIQLDSKSGGLAQWSKDDGKEHTGQVTMEVVVDEKGVASATATGALGALTGTGTADENRIAVDFVPAETRGFRGVLTAAPEGAAAGGATATGGAKAAGGGADATKATGFFQASSADSAIVRGGNVTLEKLRSQP